jgi:hypothetical protein
VLRGGLLVFAVAAALAYLHDPPWVGSVTSGLGPWEREPAGSRFRWTSAHATFYVPSDISVMTLPIKGLFGETDGRPGTVDVSEDDRWLATFTLPDSSWIRPRLPLARGSSSRRYRRIDVRVSRTIGSRRLGVKLGEAILE